MLSPEHFHRLLLFVLDSWPSSIVQSCHIVEDKTIVIIECGDEAEDDGIVLNAYTAVRIAFLALKNQGTVRVSYIGNDPLALSLTYNDKLSKRADMGTS